MANNRGDQPDDREQDDPSSQAATRNAAPRGQADDRVPPRIPKDPAELQAAGLIDVDSEEEDEAHGDLAFALHHELDEGEGGIRRGAGRVACFPGSRGRWSSWGSRRLS